LPGLNNLTCDTFVKFEMKTLISIWQVVECNQFDAIIILQEDAGGIRINPVFCLSDDFFEDRISGDGSSGGR
jgi:hypothetical protein